MVLPIYQSFAQKRNYTEKDAVFLANCVYINIFIACSPPYFHIYFVYITKNGDEHSFHSHQRDSNSWVRISLNSACKISHDS